MTLKIFIFFFFIPQIYSLRSQNKHIDIIIQKIRNSLTLCCRRKSGVALNKHVIFRHVMHNQSSDLNINNCKSRNNWVSHKSETSGGSGWFPPWRVKVFFVYHWTCVRSWTLMQLLYSLYSMFLHLKRLGRGVILSALSICNWIAYVTPCKYKINSNMIFRHYMVVNKNIFNYFPYLYFFNVIFFSL